MHTCNTLHICAVLYIFIYIKFLKYIYIKFSFSFTLKGYFTNTLTIYDFIPVFELSE